jgi:dolichyl-phosphate beta-glucosyltransferase
VTDAAGRPALSVVIPAYNEAKRLPRTLDRVIAYLREREPSFEILVVDDGSSDGTGACVVALADPRITVVRNETNRGKGYSVRRGMLLVEGARRLMTDADLSTPIEELARFEAHANEGYDVVIASRALAGANIEVRQPWYRENMGRVFNVLVRLLVLPGLRDTQCGFKLFTARAAEVSFRAAKQDGFSFDVESLFLARRAGLRILEVPVTWRNDAATHVGLGRGFLAFLDLVRIRARAVAGGYPPSAAERT